MTALKSDFKLVGLQIIILPLLVTVLFFSTSPKRLLVSSFIFFTLLWWWLSLILYILQVKIRASSGKRFSDVYYRVSSGVVSLCAVILLALGTIHQLGFMDIVFCLLFGALCLFYLRRRLVISD